MIIRTRVFDLCDNYYRNMTELALAMGLSVSQVYRVREGKRHINQKFIIGAKTAFPNYTLDELFFLDIAELRAEDTEVTFVTSREKIRLQQRYETPV